MNGRWFDRSDSLLARPQRAQLGQDIPAPPQIHRRKPAPVGGRSSSSRSSPFSDARAARANDHCAQIAIVGRGEARRVGVGASVARQPASSCVTRTCRGSIRLCRDCAGVRLGNALASVASDSLNPLVEGSNPSGPTKISSMHQALADASSLRRARSRSAVSTFVSTGPLASAASRACASIQSANTCTSSAQLSRRSAVSV
jgi:hypothetical protein